MTATAVHVPMSGGFGVPPIPAGAIVTSHSRENQSSNGDPITSAGQTPGFVPPKPTDAPLVGDPDYAEYLAWKAQKGQPAETPAEKADESAAAVEEEEDNDPGITDPKALLDLAEGAAVSDPVLRSQLNLLQRTFPTLDLSRAIGNALVYSDSKLVDAAYIKEVAGDAHADALEVAKSLVEYCVVAAEKAVEDIYAAAGSKGDWVKATAAFNAKAPQHLKTVVGTLMNSGDKAKIKAAAETVVEFAKASGLVPQPGKLVQAGGAAPAGAQALSKAAFQELHSKLDPNSRTYMQDREELFARRQLGKQQGI